jgi:putative nucleotidyltransferase with HDIG domain
MGSRTLGFRTVRTRSLIWLIAVISMAAGFGAARLIWPVSPSASGAALLACGAALSIPVSRVLTRPLRNLKREIVTSHRGARFCEGAVVAEIRELACSLNDKSSDVRHIGLDGERAYLQFVETMAEALDARDPYTAGHSLRVAAYSHAIAEALGLADKQAETIRIAARLHDIGKIGIPDSVLQKPSPLTPEEYGLIKLHPQIGRKILEKVGRFDELLGVVELHHENHDGTGYPYRLSGDAIPLSARIVHVADAFDSMITNRQYRAALGVEVAVRELEMNAGTQFDPRIVDTFVRLLRNGGLLAVPDPRLNGAVAIDQGWPVAV